MKVRKKRKLKEAIKERETKCLIEEENSTRRLAKVFQLKNKWNSLRDVFRRELKKNSTEIGKKRKWEHFDKLMFLEQATAKESPKNLNDDRVDNSHSELIIKTEETSPAEESDAEYSNDIEMPHTNNSETVVNENNLEKQSTSGENGYGEDDYHFAMSLVPAMKRVPNDRKLRMRMKILQVLCEEGETNNFV